jgi:hypothetical protein
MCLQYAGVSIAYTSEDAAVAEWIGPFLAGWTARLVADLF